MIGYIVSGTVLAVSSVFNVGMTIYKHKDTIRKITKKFRTCTCPIHCYRYGNWWWCVL